jgi:DnaJ-related protein SCJ1
MAIFRSLSKGLFVLVLICSAFTISSVSSNEDFYKILGIDRSASEKEMKSSYRKLSAKYHPDRNPGDKSAQEMFIKITKAYETLSDPEKRKIYDIYGEEGLNKESQVSENRKPRGQNAHVEMEVTLEELYNGTTKSFSIQKNVVCKECHGTGGKLGHTKTCPKCNGRGSVVEQMNTGMGFTFQVQNTCNKCGGKGIIFKESCPFCQGRRVIREDKTLKVEVEKGMKDNEKIIFPKESEQHPDATPGDLIVTLKQKPHYFFNLRDGDNLHASIKLNLKDALLGYNQNFRHLDGRSVKLSSNKPTQPFEIKVIEGEGMPIHNFSSSKGKLFIKHIVRLPESLTEEEKKLIEQIL